MGCLCCTFSMDRKNRFRMNKLSQSVRFGLPEGVLCVRREAKFIYSKKHTLFVLWTIFTSRLFGKQYKPYRICCKVSKHMDKPRYVNVAVLFVKRIEYYPASKESCK